MYGTRQFGNERWDQWTVAFSGRVQGTNTATVSENWYGYVFLNQTNRRVVFASGDVFSNADEMREVCRTLSDGTCGSLSEFSRTTGGAALTWARADLITGDRLSVHFFFEAGSETRSPIAQPSATSAAAAAGESPRFIARGGVSLDYIHQPESSTIPNIYSLGLVGQSGSWPLLPARITEPEQLRSRISDIEDAYPGWGFMIYGRAQW
jgi:hypothetical protein